MRSRPRPFLALAPLLAVLCGGCGSQAPDPRPNFLLISIDSLRADHLGCYGYARETSPAIDRLASEGVRFSQATSSAPWTLPAHASLFTALPTSAHGTTAATPLDGARLTLAEALRKGGYETVGFWAGPYLHPRFGLDQGFERWINCASYSFEDEDTKRANEESHLDITNPSVLEQFRLWLEEEPDAPFLAFVHLWDVHYDYIPPAPFDTRFSAPDYAGAVDGRVPRETLAGADLAQLVALYDGEIAWTDLHVGRLLALLEARGLDRDTVVVLTSDHGEEFFEHGRFGHRKALYEESIAVPLIVRLPERFAPGRVERGGVVAAAAGVVDVAPTLVELAGLPAMPDVLGRSLVPELTGQATGNERIAVSELQRGEKQLLALRGSRWKVLYEDGSRRPHVGWDLAADPGERNDSGVGAVLDPTRQAVVDALREHLEGLARRHAAGPTLEAEPLPKGLENALRDLGYVGDDE